MHAQKAFEITLNYNDVRKYIVQKDKSTLRTHNTTFKKTETWAATGRHDLE